MVMADRKIQKTGTPKWPNGGHNLQNAYMNLHDMGRITNNQGQPQSYDSLSLHPAVFKALKKQTGSAQKAQTMLEQLHLWVRSPWISKVGPYYGTSIPNQAHFIWFHGDKGNKHNPLPPAYQKTLKTFRTLNPKTRITLWSDRPFEIQKAMFDGPADKVSNLEIKPFFELFSKKKDWNQITSHEKNILHSAVLRELSGPHKNVHSAKDIAQLIILKHEPGWFFDLDTQFFKPLPQSTSSHGVGSLFNKTDNGIMCFNKEGVPDLDNMLKRIAGDYNVDNEQVLDLNTKKIRDVYLAYENKTPGFFSKQWQKITNSELSVQEKKPSRPKKAPLLHPDNSINKMIPSYINQSASTLNELHTMFDIKRIPGKNRGLLTDETALLYNDRGYWGRGFQNAKDEQYFDQLDKHNVFFPPMSELKWEKPSPRLTRRTSTSW